VNSAAGRNPTLGYIAPFLIFVGMMGMERLLALPPGIAFPIRFAAVAAALLTISRPYIRLRPAMPVASVVVGVVVFLVWIGPDLLFGYRHHWLFENSLTGKAESTLPAALRANIGFLLLRTLSATINVPILEELFWRGWLMRWIIHKDFEKVPLGKYTPAAFWLVALLFASEHGAFWEVGLLAGIVYNWWMVRTRSLADCIWAHAVTNGLLCAYVIATGHWQYWL
jgi:CAAX prenyl protease-like protein